MRNLPGVKSLTQAVHHTKLMLIHRQLLKSFMISTGHLGASSPQKARQAALTTHSTLTSNVKFMNFYPFNDIETISPRPMLFITGDKAHSREFSEDAFQRAAQPKELYIVPDAGHVDLYDRTKSDPVRETDGFL